MAFRDLQSYLTIKEKCIMLFGVLNRHKYIVPTEIKNYIFQLSNLQVIVHHDFDDDIKKFKKITKDEMLILNYMIIGFITDLTNKALLITEHGRRKVVKSNDFEYALGVYPRKNSKLVKKMMKNGSNMCDYFLDNKLNKTRKYNLAINSNTCKTYIKLTLNCPLDSYLKGSKYYYPPHLEQFAPIYIAAILEFLIKDILDIGINNIESNIEIKSLLLDLFLLK